MDLHFQFLVQRGPLKVFIFIYIGKYKNSFDSMSSHSILGLSANCSQEEIRQAYKQKALQYHPDKKPHDPEAEANFKKVIAAYEELTNPKPKQAPPGAGRGCWRD